MSNKQEMDKEELRELVKNYMAARHVLISDAGAIWYKAEQGMWCMMTENMVADMLAREIEKGNAQ